jgi:hypothetical protein
LGYEDTSLHRFKMMLHSIQSLAGPLKICRKDGLPASSLLVMTDDVLSVIFVSLPVKAKRSAG